MTSVQERLKQSRTPLDKWSTREHLCLASAVSCSGDQNWMSVSRTMKLVCSTGANSVPRPADWYSQKSCAVQYGNLLENVETPKRKKRTSESSGTDTPTSVDTPTDLVLRKLTEERIQELKDDLRKDQEEYSKLYKEIKELQGGNLAEERLLAMWNEMEQEEEAKRLENIKLETELREREQRKQELQRSWRGVTTAVTVANVKLETAITDVNSKISQKPKPPTLQLQADTTTQPQTSPLLSSLLKSPTSNAPAVGGIHVTSVARSTAPTITTLLTGGSISIKQPVVIFNNTDLGHMLTRPASGPPTDTANAAQQLISPSQSAPTLSMLLEKNKGNGTQITTTVSDVSDENVKKEQIDESQPVKKMTTKAPLEVNDDVMADNNDMDVDVDETDPNEEQQLLEVFKNIGNIEMEIDAEFLTVMNEEPPNESADLAVNFENKLDSTVSENTKSEVEEDKKVKLEIVKTENENNLAENDELQKKEIHTTVEKSTTEPEVAEEKNKTDIIKVETSSSDDSSDNVPLSAVATVLENKDPDKIEHTEVEELVKTEDAQEDNKIFEKKEEFVEIKEEMDDVMYEKGENEFTLNEKNHDETHNEDIVEKTLEIIDESKSIKIENEATSSTGEETKVPKIEENFSEDIAEVEHIEVIPITDTDTDSSCTPEVEKTINLEQKHFSKNERPKAERLVSEDSDSTSLPMTPALPPTVTPARPPALRKLRERDRSESPMIGEDDTEHGTAANLRLRRRASSTPLIDSIPNSPASMSDREDRELRTAYKKSLLSILNIMQQKHGRQISLLEESFTSSKSGAVKYEEVCLRPMDFQVIQQKIENGSIRNSMELKRDILLMCQNALMLYAPDTEQYNAAMQIKQDCRNISELCQNNADKDIKNKESKVNISSTTNSTPAAPNTSATKSRSGFRKSQRIS